MTNDALVFCGNLAVTESGSSRITYYWNIYNLMGDPSLSDLPGRSVGEPGDAIPRRSSRPGPPSISRRLPDSYVGLTKDGVLIGAGTVDAMRGR